MVTSPAPIFVLIAVIGAGIYVFVQTRTTHFDCPGCGRAFKLSYVQYALAEVLLTRRAAGRRWVTCPYCHTREMLEPVRDGRD